MQCRLHLLAGEGAGSGRARVVAFPCRSAEATQVHDDRRHDVGAGIDSWHGSERCHWVVAVRFRRIDEGHRAIVGLQSARQRLGNADPVYQHDDRRAAFDIGGRQFHRRLRGSGGRRAAGEHDAVQTRIAIGAVIHDGAIVEAAGFHERRPRRGRRWHLVGQQTHDQVGPGLPGRHLCKRQQSMRCEQTTQVGKRRARFGRRPTPVGGNDQVEGLLIDSLGGIGPFGVEDLVADEREGPEPVAGALQDGIGGVGADIFGARRGQQRQQVAGQSAGTGPDLEDAQRFTVGKLSDDGQYGIGDDLIGQAARRRIRVELFCNGRFFAGQHRYGVLFASKRHRQTLAGLAHQHGFGVAAGVGQYE